VEYRTLQDHQYGEGWERMKGTTDRTAELAAAIGRAIPVESLPSGDYLVCLPLSFGDGDHIGVYALEGPEGWMLSDDGELWWRVETHGRTCIKRSKRFESILKFYGIEFDAGEFTMKLGDRTPDDLTYFIFTFAQALLAIECLP
jgi:hypothetical protein